jgi:hypothetical protein
MSLNVKTGLGQDRTLELGPNAVSAFKDHTGRGRPMPGAPIAVVTAVSDLIQQILELSLTAQHIRQQLEALEQSISRADAECLLHLTDAIKEGLVRTLETALDTVKDLRSADAETWLRRRLGELSQSPGDER